MREIVGNILDVKDGLIFQCVNTLGKMGAGLALQTKRRFPHVWWRYREFVADAKACWSGFPKSLLGCACQWNGHVLLFTQTTVGRTGVHTDLDALNSALKSATMSVARDTRCYFPYRMGCGFGGADWTRVEQLIQHYFPDGIIVRLPEKKG